MTRTSIAYLKIIKIGADIKAKIEVMSIVYQVTGWQVHGELSVVRLLRFSELDCYSNNGRTKMVEQI